MGSAIRISLDDSDNVDNIFNSSFGSSNKDVLKAIAPKITSDTLQIPSYTPQIPLKYSSNTPHLYLSNTPLIPLENSSNTPQIPLTYPSNIPQIPLASLF